MIGSKSVLLTVLACSVLVCFQVSAWSQILPGTRYLLDVPQITVIPSPVELGINFKLKETVERQSSFSTATDSSEETKINEDFTDTETIKHALSSGINFAIDFDKVPKVTAKASLADSDSSEMTQAYKFSRNYESALKYTEQARAMMKTSVSAAMDESDGYVAAGFTLRNDGATSVTVKDVHFAVVSGDRVLVSRDAVMDSTCYENSLENTAKCTPTTGAAKLSRVLHPGDVFPQAIHIPLQSSYEILNALRSPDEPTLTLTYTINWNGQDTSQSQVSARALQRSVLLQVVDKDGRRRQFYVSTDAGADGKVSPFKALQVAGLRPTLDPGGQYLMSLAGVKSDCSPGDLKSVPSYYKAPEQGAWVVAEISDNAFTGKIGDLAPAGSKFVVAFVTRADVIQSMKTVQHISPFFVSTDSSRSRYLLANDFGEPALGGSPPNFQPDLPVFGVVHAGDIVTLRVRGKHAFSSVLHLSGSDVIPAPPTDFPSSGDFKGLCAWANCEEYLPDGHLKDLDSIQEPSDLNLAIDLGYGPIDLNGVVPIGTRWFSRLSNGFYQLTFMVTDTLLRNQAHAVLRLTAMPLMATLKDYGRTVSPPIAPPRTALTPNDQLNYHWAGEWAAAAPDSGPKQVPELREFEADGDLIALDPKLEASHLGTILKGGK